MSERDDFRCSDARDRTRNRSEWSSEMRTDTTSRGYRRTPVTSIGATCTVFLDRRKYGLSRRFDEDQSPRQR